MVSQSEYLGEETSDVLYTWTLEPETAGSLTFEGNRAFVEWNGEFRGEANVSYYYENTCGASAVSNALTVNVFNSTGIDEQDTASIEVYPNPATDVIHVRTHLESKATLRIIDMTGKVVYECGMRNDECVIPTSSLGGSGVYTLQVIQNDVVTNVRFVVNF